MKKRFSDSRPLCFLPGYRRKVLINQVEERFKQMVKNICQENEWDICVMEVMRDHCHRRLPETEMD